MTETKEKQIKKHDDLVSNEINIKPIPSNTQFPKLFQNSKRTIIAYPKSGGGYKNGLTQKDIENIMPSLLGGVKYDSSEFWTRYDEFWRNFKFVLSGKPRVLDISNPKGIVTYKMLLEHKNIARSKADIINKPEALWYIEDVLKEAKEENKRVELRRKAYAALDKMSPTDKRGIFRLVDEYGRNPEEMIEEQLNVLLDEVIQKNASKFLDKAENENKDVLIFIHELIAYKVINKKRNNFYYGDPSDDNFIGTDMDSVVDYMNNPKNNNTKLAMQEQLLVMQKNK